MSTRDANAQTWIQRGGEAYLRLGLSEAAANFEKTVATDLLSAQAPSTWESHLCSFT